MLKIGSQLKYLREKEKMTQKQVAEYLHITPQTVSKSELDKSYPDLDQIVQLSELYHVRTDKLLGQAKPNFLDFLAEPDSLRNYFGVPKVREGEKDDSKIK